MNIVYFDCRGGLSAQAALAALQAAGGSAAGPPGAATQAILAALGDRPCSPQEKEAAGTVGCLLASLGIDAAYFSPLPLENLAGAALDLVKGLPVQPAGGPVTAAGAALARALGRGAAPPFTLRAAGTGRGAGALVRAFLGGAPPAAEEVMVLEANLDDYNPEFYPHLVDLLLCAGALDVFLTPVIMKKGRPGTQVTVLATPDRWRDQASLLLAETSTLGLRFRTEGRLTLPRRMIELATPYGPVRAKVAEGPDGRRKVKPEYEDCRKIAAERGLLLTAVYRAALEAAWRRVPGEGEPAEETDAE